jgi:hypothetical protein
MKKFELKSGKEKKRRDEKRSSSIEDVEEDFLIDEVRKK